MKLTAVIRLSTRVCCNCIPSTEGRMKFAFPQHAARASNAITQLGPNKLLKIASNQGVIVYLYIQRV